MKAGRGPYQKQQSCAEVVYRIPSTLNTITGDLVWACYEIGWLLRLLRKSDRQARYTALGNANDNIRLHAHTSYGHYGHLRPM